MNTFSAVRHPALPHSISDPLSDLAYHLTVTYGVRLRSSHRRDTNSPSPPGHGHGHRCSATSPPASCESLDWSPAEPPTTRSQTGSRSVLRPSRRTCLGSIESSTFAHERASPTYSARPTDEHAPLEGRNPTHKRPSAPTAHPRRSRGNIAPATVNDVDAQGGRDRESPVI